MAASTAQTADLLDPESIAAEVLGDGPEEASVNERIESVVKAIEPDFERHQEEELQSSEPITPDRLQPIQRPNGDRYFPRPVTGALTDVEMMRRGRENGINILLAGYPGTGKTALLEAAFDGQVITVNGNADMIGSDFKGSYVSRPGVDGGAPQIEWVDGPLVRAMREGKVLFVDDMTLIPANVISLLYPLMDGRDRFLLTDHEGEEIVAREGFYVCGAHNPDAPGAMLAEALSSRFQVHMIVSTDLLLAQDQLGVDPRFVQAAAELQKQRASGVIGWAPEMRELLAFKRNQEVFGTRVAVNNVVTTADVDSRDAIIEHLCKWWDWIEPLSHMDSAKLGQRAAS